MNIVAVRGPRWGGQTSRGGLAVGLALSVLLLCGGCPTTPTDTTTPSDGTSNTSTNSGDVPSLSTALALSSGDSTKQYQGSIVRQTDVGYFDLGTLNTGDRIIVDVQRTSGNLDADIAIFDSREYLVAFNDDRTSDDVNPKLDFEMPEASGDYRLAIASYPGGFTAGNYTATVTVKRNVGATAPKGELLYLDWRGGQNITIPNVGIFNLSAFSATDVGLAADQTTALKQRVAAVVQERYKDFNLTVLSSDDGAPPSAAHSTIYFGGDSQDAFAISEQIDTFNEDPSDDAIVFTHSFKNAFSVQPTLDQMATALGNTVAHETGHLLGLVHTANGNELMDTTSGNDRILSTQEFGTARLDTSVFAFGWQDAVEILTWVLGLSGS